MEGRFEQLIVIVVVIAFSLFDLFLRWAKRRAKQRQAGMPEEDSGELVLGDEEVEDFEAPGEVALEREEPWAADVPPPPLPTEAPSSAERVPARAAPSRAPVGTLVPLPYLAQRPCRRKRWALGPGDARRGIVLMTVLGPCRAQEMDRR